MRHASAELVQAIDMEWAAAATFRLPAKQTTTGEGCAGSKGIGFFGVIKEEK